MQENPIGVRGDVEPVLLQAVTVVAAVLALGWGALHLALFADADSDRRMMMAALMTGLLGAGSLVLWPAPYANVAWCSTMGVCCAAAALRHPGAIYVGLTLLASVYAIALQIAGVNHWLRSVRLLHTRAVSARHERVMALLLADFEQQAGDVLWQVDARGRLTHGSPRLAEMLGHPEGSIAGRRLRALLRRCDVDAGAVRHVAAAGRPFHDLALTIRVGGRTRHLSVRGKPVFGEDGRHQGWRGVASDVTKRVEDERRLQFQAHADALTGLADRYTLRDQIGQALHERRPGVLLCLDLDHFKNINDSVGHSAGDRVLQEVARRLTAHVRPGDLVARLGGDEFAIVLLGEYPHDVLRVFADRLVAALDEPQDLGDKRWRIGASVGITRLSAASDVDELLAQADMALYASKYAGRGCHAIYDHALGERNRRRVAIEAALRVAIERDELRLAFQPKVDIDGWTVCGAEALLRWTHPELGRGGPAEFIAVAERSGLIDQLGNWALREACRAASQELRGLCVAVNVSPLQFVGGQLVAQVRQALRETGLPADRLELEITESVFVEDAETALRQLHDLRALGVRIALDDFGTGYSSLAYLRRFPFDTLKIDRSFVVEVLTQPDARAIVRMIAELARTLGMRTVCEGIETVEQLEAVRAAGCDEMQGYLVAAPKPLHELARLVAQWTSAAPQRPGSSAAAAVSAAAGASASPRTVAGALAGPGSTTATTTPTTATTAAMAPLAPPAAAQRPVRLAA